MLLLTSAFPALVSLWFLLLGLMWIVSLHWPAVGRRFYNKAWYGRFDDLNRRHIAYWYGICMGLNSIFQGLGMALGYIAWTQHSPLVWPIGIVFGLAWTISWIMAINYQIRLHRLNRQKNV